MYIALCLVVNIKCIVCVFCFVFLKGGGSKLIANQTGDGQVGLVPMSYCLFGTGRKLRGKKSSWNYFTQSPTLLLKRQKKKIRVSL